MRILSVLAVALLFSLQASAQVFWSENFASGIPAGWTNVDPSGNNALWTVCGNPAAGQVGGCPAIWTDTNNQQSPFAATTATNGFVTMDSDRVGQISSDHDSRLTTTAINCSAAAQVWARFENHIGVFVVNADENAVLRVSTNLQDWTTYTIFPGLTTAERWSDNPEVAVINISDVAAGSSTVYLQWRWVGNYEYHWSLDDVSLSDQDPRPPFDLRVNDFFAIAPNVATPASQVEPFGFIADVANVGSQDQTNLNLNVTVTNDVSGTVVYNESINYASIPSDVTVENVFFPMQFTPPATPAIYTGTYTLSGAQTDGNPADNTKSFQFAVTDTLFSKELMPTRSVAPAADNNYSYGNCYYTPNGSEVLASHIIFGVANAEELAGRDVTIFLYEWEGDINDDGDANPGAEYDPNAPVGVNTYSFTGEEGEDLIAVPVDFDGPVQLQDDKYYIALITYQVSDDQDFFLLASEENDFNAMAFYTDSLGAPRYAGILDVGNTGTLGTVGFGRDIVPVVRLSVLSATSASEVALPEAAVRLFPNPVNEQLTLAFDLAAASAQASVRLFDYSGRLLKEQTFQGVQHDRISIDVKDLAVGSYLVRINTDAGVKTLKFVVQR